MVIVKPVLLYILPLLSNIFTFQYGYSKTAVKAGFCNAIVNGAVIKDSKQFDGLDALLTGSSTEIVAGGTGFDLSTFTKVKDKAAEFVAVLDDFLSILVEKPDALSRSLQESVN